MKKDKTHNEYQRRIRLALEFVNTHLDQRIQLEDVARASHFSSFHFHRIFHALVGETVNDYISRKRMEKAACRLLGNPDWNITQVAESGGFSSSANFARAFKLYFGVSPSELRNPNPENENSKIGNIYRKYGKEFNPQDLYSQFLTDSSVFDPERLEKLLMDIKIEDMPEKPIVYLTSPNGYNLDSIYQTWDKVLNWARTKGISDQRERLFAICHDNPVITPEEKCRYDASIVVEAETDIRVSAPFERSVIPAGKYAIAYYKDVGEKISNFMTEICSHWFPDSGYEPDDYPPVFHYLNDSREDGYVEMDVYIKLKELEIN